MARNTHADYAKSLDVLAKILGCT